MTEHLPLLAGAAFALAGLLLLMSQVLVVDLSRAYRHVCAAIRDGFNHDTQIFPDYVAEDQTFKYHHES